LNIPKVQTEKFSWPYYFRIPWIDKNQQTIETF